MEREEALRRSIEMFFAALFGGVFSFLVANWYTDQTLYNFSHLLISGIVVILYFYIWFKIFYKK